MWWAGWFRDDRNEKKRTLDICGLVPYRGNYCRDYNGRYHYISSVSTHGYPITAISRGG